MGIIPEGMHIGRESTLVKAVNTEGEKNSKYRPNRILRNKLGMVKERIIGILNLENKTLCYTAATCMVY